MSDTHLTAASHPFPLFERNEKGKIVERTFNATPLDDVKISELDNWVQARYIATARASLSDSATTKEREETLNIAMRTAVELSAFSGLGARMLSTADGMARLVLAMISEKHPNVTFEQLRKLMFSPDNIREANRIFKRLNLPEMEGKKGVKTQTQKQDKAKKRFLSGESTAP